jgi:hypothetical protein
VQAGRETWQISWMEHDSSMTQPQVWVERTLEHLRDAERYGVHAALGIHWRVAALAMNVHALAAGGWSTNHTQTGVAMLEDFFTGELGTIYLQRISTYFYPSCGLTLPEMLGTSLSDACLNQRTMPRSRQRLGRAQSGQAPLSDGRLRHLRQRQGVSAVQAEAADAGV